jgi:hypothetical protein
MRILTLCVGIATSLTLGACASTGGGSPYLTYDDCFFANAVTDWRPLDSMNLVVFTGGRQPYHVQLSMRSMNLRYEDTIAFTDRDGRICPFGGDSIVINGGVTDRISIASIRRLTDSQLAELYRTYNIAVPEIIDVPADADE